MGEVDEQYSTNDVQRPAGDGPDIDKLFIREAPGGLTRVKAPETYTAEQIKDLLRADVIIPHPSGTPGLWYVRWYE